MADDWFTAQGAPGGGMAQYRQAGQAAGQDMSWMNQPGAISPQYLGQVGAASGGMQYPGGSATFNEQGGGYQAPGAGPTAPPTGNPTDRAYVQSQLANWYASHGLTPTGPGTGPTDIAYYTDKILETGGWTNNTAKGEDNINYWTSRIPQDLAQAGQGGAGMGGPGGAGAAGAGAAGYGTLSGGTNPLTQIAADALTTSPGYQFRLQQGQQALERSAAAKGTLLTGGTLKGLTRYAQDTASNEYGNQYNRLFGEQTTRANQLMGLSNLGLNAAGQSAGVGTSYANQAGNLLGGQATSLSNLITGGGNAASAGTIAQGNAFQQGLSGASNAAQMYYLSKLLGGGTTGTTPGQTPPYFAY